MIFKKFDLMEFDESEADNLFKGFCMQRWGYHSPARYNPGPLLEINLAVSWPSVSTMFHDLNFSAFKDLDHSEWNQIKQTPPKEGEELTVSLKSEELDWRVLGHFLRIKHLVNRHGIFSVTVIQMGVSDHFAIVALNTPVDRNIILNTVFSQVLYFIVPYVPGSKGSHSSGVQC